MKKYDSYKSSGIEWIGEVPKHWLTKKIKHNSYLKARVGWKGLRSDEFLTDGFSYLLTGTDIKNEKLTGIIHITLMKRDTMMTRSFN